MSELINKNDNCATIRWKLLTGVSALALTAHLASAGVAKAEDASQPQVWIELGGQLSRLDAAVEPFAPPVMDNRPSIFAPSQKFEKAPLYSIDEDGKISFQPENSDWIFSASIRFGHSRYNRDQHQQTHPKTFHLTVGSYPPIPKYPGAAKFADTSARNSEHHLILDFQAGKDVGLGMFGGKGSSTVNLGVRFAQFTGKSDIALKSDPDWHFSYRSKYGYKLTNGQVYHSNQANLRASRSFHGVGPSLSWNGSTLFAGNPDSSELTFDWGVNAALLFGRQRAKVHHQTTGQYRSAGKYGRFRHVTYQPTPVNKTRSRNVTVPNVGGFAGLSFRYADAKVSFGYKADMFFGAIDGGIDARKNENRAFFGPFASVSVGIGD